MSRSLWFIRSTSCLLPTFLHYVLSVGFLLEWTVTLFLWCCWCASQALQSCTASDVSMENPGFHGLSHTHIQSNAVWSLLLYSLVLLAIDLALVNECDGDWRLLYNAHRRLFLFTFFTGDFQVHTTLTRQCSLSLLTCTALLYKQSQSLFAGAQLLSYHLCPLCPVCVLVQFRCKSLNQSGFLFLQDKSPIFFFPPHNK